MDHAGRKAVEDTMINESTLQGQVELGASKMSTETASNEVDRVPVDCRVNVEKSPVEDDGVGADASMLSSSCGELAAVRDETLAEQLLDVLKQNLSATRGVPVTKWMQKWRVRVCTSR